MVYVLYKEPQTGKKCWEAVSDSANAESTLNEILSNLRCDLNDIRLVADAEDANCKQTIVVTLPMSPEMLDLIRYVKSIINMAQKKVAMHCTFQNRCGMPYDVELSSWYSIAMKNFMDIDLSFFEALDISRSERTFNEILEFPVTEEMLCAEESELYKFASPFKKIMEVG